MTDKKISALTELTDPTVSDFFPIDDASDLTETKILTLANLATFLEDACSPAFAVTAGSAGYATTAVTATSASYSLEAGSAGYADVSAAIESITGALKYWGTDATGTQGAYDLPTGGGAGQNVLINSCMRIAQLGTSFTSATLFTNADDSYTLDQWILLSEVDDTVDVTRENDSTYLPTGGSTAICLDIETANKKFGIFQPVETAYSAPLIGGSASMQFKARCSTGSGTVKLRAGVLAWDGTADVITSDIVSAWNAEDVNITPAANWTFENTPAALADLTDSYQTYTIENIPIDTASTKNVGVFIWSDKTTTTVGEKIWITDVKLESGQTATDYEPCLLRAEIADCQRYIWKNYELETPPAATGTTHTTGYVILTSSVANGAYYLFVPFGVYMRKAPTVTFYSANGVTTRASNASAVDYDANSASAPATTKPHFTWIYNNSGSAMTITANFVFVGILARAQL